MHLLEELKQKVRSWIRRGPFRPEDPWSRVRQPVRRGPSSRGAGVALEEPPPRRFTDLYNR